MSSNDKCGLVLHLLFEQKCGQSDPKNLFLSSDSLTHSLCVYFFTLLYFTYRSVGLCWCHSSMRVLSLIMVPIYFASEAFFYLLLYLTLLYFTRYYVGDSKWHHDNQDTVLHYKAYCKEDVVCHQGSEQNGKATL